MLERLEQLARDAERMPWEKDASDVPYSVRAAFRDGITPEDVLKLIAVVKAAQRKMAAYDVLANKPIGEFTGNEVVACDEADDALRGALVELERP